MVSHFLTIHLCTSYLSFLSVGRLVGGWLYVTQSHTFSWWNVITLWAKDHIFKYYRFQLNIKLEATTSSIACEISIRMFKCNLIIFFQFVFFQIRLWNTISFFWIVVLQKIRTFSWAMERYAHLNEDFELKRHYCTFSTALHLKVFRMSTLRIRKLSSNRTSSWLEPVEP